MVAQSQRAMKPDGYEGDEPPAIFLRVWRSQGPTQRIPCRRDVGCFVLFVAQPGAGPNLATATGLGCGHRGRYSRAGLGAAGRATAKQNLKP